jgi:hypothetical protein
LAVDARVLGHNAMASALRRRTRFLQLFDVSIDMRAFDPVECVTPRAHIVDNTPVVVVRHFQSSLAGKFITPFRLGEIDDATRL